jgi:hypothetical protein
LVDPRTFAGRKNNCMFGLAPRSSNRRTTSKPSVSFGGSIDARPPSFRVYEPTAVNNGASPKMSH